MDLISFSGIPCLRRIDSMDCMPNCRNTSSITSSKRSVFENKTPENFSYSTGSNRSDSFRSHDRNKLMKRSVNITSFINDLICENVNMAIIDFESLENPFILQESQSNSKFYRLFIGIIE